MTLLQISEKIRDHLIKQKAQSSNESGACKYRNSVGNMCAVGCLIPDSVYSPELESKVVDDNVIAAAVGLSLKMKLDVDAIALMKSWQNYHDSTYSQRGRDDELKFSANYEHWIDEGAELDHLQSPSAMHEHLKTIERFDMTGEITKRHINQVSGYIADHLLKQGKQAATEGKCQYRADDGCMCAVGVVIDPEHYDANFEGGSLSSPEVRRAVASSLGIDEGLIDYGTPMHKMMRAWQRYHDCSYTEFTEKEINHKAREINLMLDNKNEFPDLKD